MRKVKELSLDRLVELIEDNIPDPRRPGGNIRHKLVDLFVIILLGIICGCETWIDIEDYAKAKVESIFIGHWTLLLTRMSPRSTEVMLRKTSPLSGRSLRGC